MNDDNAVETIAEGLETAVRKMEKALGLKMDPGKLSEACDLSNQAAAISKNAMTCAGPARR